MNENITVGYVHDLSPPSNVISSCYDSNIRALFLGTSNGKIYCFGRPGVRRTIIFDRKDLQIRKIFVPPKRGVIICYFSVKLNRKESNMEEEQEGMCTVSLQTYEIIGCKFFGKKVRHMRMFNGKYFMIVFEQHPYYLNFYRFVSRNGKIFLSFNEPIYMVGVNQLSKIDAVDIRDHYVVLCSRFVNYNEEESNETTISFFDLRKIRQNEFFRSNFTARLIHDVRISQINILNPEKSLIILTYVDGEVGVFDLSLPRKEKIDDLKTCLIGQIGDFKNDRVTKISSIRCFGGLKFLMCLTMRKRIPLVDKKVAYWNKKEVEIEIEEVEGEDKNHTFVGCRIYSFIEDEMVLRCTHLHNYHNLGIVESCSLKFQENERYFGFISAERDFHVLDLGEGNSCVLTNLVTSNLTSEIENFLMLKDPSMDEWFQSSVFNDESFPLQGGIFMREPGPVSYCGEVIIRHEMEKRISASVYSYRIRKKLFHSNLYNGRNEGKYNRGSMDGDGVLPKYDSLSLFGIFKYSNRVGILIFQMNEKRIIHLFFFDSTDMGKRMEKRITLPIEFGGKKIKFSRIFAVMECVVLVFEEDGWVVVFDIHDFQEPIVIHFQVILPKNEEIIESQVGYVDFLNDFVLFFLTEKGFVYCYSNAGKLVYPVIGLDVDFKREDFVLFSITSYKGKTSVSQSPEYKEIPFGFMEDQEGKRGENKNSGYLTKISSSKVFESSRKDDFEDDNNEFSSFDELFEAPPNKEIIERIFINIPHGLRGNSIKKLRKGKFRKERISFTPKFEYSRKMLDLQDGFILELLFRDKYSSESGDFKFTFFEDSKKVKGNILFSLTMSKESFAIGLYNSRIEEFGEFSMESFNVSENSRPHVGVTGIYVFYNSKDVFRFYNSEQNVIYEFRFSFPLKRKLRLRHVDVELISNKNGELRKGECSYVQSYVKKLNIFFNLGREFLVKEFIRRRNMEIEKGETSVSNAYCQIEGVFVCGNLIEDTSHFVFLNSKSAFISDISFRNSKLARDKSKNIKEDENGREDEMQIIKSEVREKEILKKQKDRIVSAKMLDERPYLVLLSNSLEILIFEVLKLGESDRRQDFVQVFHLNLSEYRISKILRPKIMRITDGGNRIIIHERKCFIDIGILFKDRSKSQEFHILEPSFDNTPQKKEGRFLGKVIWKVFGKGEADVFEKLDDGFFDEGFEDDDEEWKEIISLRSTSSKNKEL